MKWLGLGVLSILLASQDPSEKLRQVLKDKEVQGPWVYNDLAKGFAEARQSGKPLLVVFR